MSAAPNPLALDVVTDAFLLQRIVSFQRGVPRDIVELAQWLRLRRLRRRIRMKYDDNHGVRAGTTSLVKYAIEGPNLRALQRLFRYYMEQPRYCRTQQALSFHNAWLYAVERGQLEIAQWIEAQPALPCLAPPSEIWEAVITSQRTKMLAYVVEKRPELLPAFRTHEVALIAATGSVEMLEWIKEHTSRAIPYRAHAVKLAAEHGHLAMVQHFHRHFEGEWSTEPMNAAARKGHLEIVTFLHENRQDGCSTAAMNTAARYGHLEVVRFLHEKRTEGCTTKAMDGAAANGHLDVVQFLQEHRTEGCTSKAMDEAARAGYFDIVRYLHEHRRERATVAAAVEAAKNGHLDVIQFLHENDCVGAWTPAVMDAAAASGHLKIVRFLHEHRSEGCTTDALGGAASRGFREVVFFLHEQRSEGCTTKAMDQAARNGHLDIVQFLHENRGEGCTDNAVNLAAEHDHLEIVRFLLLHRTEGCTAHAMDRAAEHGHLDTVRYLLENHTGACTSKALEAAIQRDWKDIAHALITKDPLLCSPQALLLAAKSGDFAFTQHLFGLAPRVLPWTATEAALRGHTEIVKFILERVPSCRHNHVLVGAAAGGSMETVQFLHENYHEHCTPDALYEAARSGHIGVLRYLLRHCSVTPTKLLLRAAYSGDLDTVKFVLDHWPNPNLAEAHAIAVQRENPEIVEFLAQVIARGEPLFIDAETHPQ